MHRRDELRVYLAGPIQHSGSRGKGWRERVKSMYDSIDWVDPIDKYDSSEEATESTTESSDSSTTGETESSEWEDERIVEEDKQLILDCDAVLLHYELTPSWGTPREQEFAVQHGIPVYVQTAVPDSKLSPWLTVDAEMVGYGFGDVVPQIKEDFDHR